MPARRTAREEVAAVVGGVVLESSWVRRLGRISFLGTLDRHRKSSRRSNRLDHSLGVAHAALQAAHALDLDGEERRTFVAAALVHDIGHYPLSHAAEAAFTRTLGANHHEVGRWIILGAGSIPRVRSLRPALEDSGIDPDAVWAVLEGEGRGRLAALAPLLRAPINLDTLEGIPRAAVDFRVRRAPVPESPFVWIGDEVGLRPEALEPLDAFWSLKDRVYSEVINRPSNILAEARLSELVAGAVSEGVYETFVEFDDARLAALLGPRFESVALRDGEDDDYELRADDEDDRVLTRVVKRYGVHPRVSGGPQGLPAAQWSARYGHRRERARLVPRHQQMSLPLGMAGLVLETPEI